MKNSSLYRTLTTNQLKMAIFLIGFLLITAPGIAEAKLITLGATVDTVSVGNLLGIGTTNPASMLQIISNGTDVEVLKTTGYSNTAGFSPAATQQRARGTLASPSAVQAGDKLGGVFANGWNGTNFSSTNAGAVVISASETFSGSAQGTYITFDTTANGTTTRTEKLRIDNLGNVGIGITNPTTKLHVSGSSLSTLATTHSLLGGAGNVIIMADNAGSLFSATPEVFTSSISVSTLYHIKKWFTPQAGQTISSSGTTVTMLNPVSNYQFSSSMVGSRLTINGENRVITAYTSTSVVTVDSVYSTNYSAVSNTLWGVYGKAVEIASDGSVSTYSEVGNMAIRKRSGDGNVYIPALLDSTNNYYLPSSVLYLDKDFPIKWSGSASYSSSANDVGLRRTATGTLEIFNGTGTTPGTAADYRDLNLRSLNPLGGNVGIGTTNPEQPLHIVSSGSPNTNFLYDVYYDGATTNPSFITRRARGSILSPSSVLAGDSLATLGGGGYGTTQFTPYSKGSLKIFAAENWTDTAQGTYISLSTTANGGTSVSEKIRIADNGNVGIGITNPSAKLYVAGTSLNTLATTHSLLGGNGNVVVMADNTGTLYSTSTASFISGNSLDLWKGTKNGNIWNGDAGEGNVGIGTTTPSTKLQIVTSGTNGVVIGNSAYPAWMGAEGLYVDGSFRANTYLVNSGNGINWGASTAKIIGYSLSTSDTNSYLGFWTGESGNNHERMRIVNNGNIGIGTTTPAANLDVAGTVKLGTAGGAFTAMGTCTIASTAISTTKTAYTCTGVPASNTVAVNCSGSTTQSGSGTVYCRATGNINQVACNTSAANTTAMTWTCMWIKP